jgi:UDP-N-acetylglucosamine--N-acetylmuramyl-(pentapeptide) pyrophosphoryl-undecaprenol N-acetylglucosamine transferase
VTIVLCGGGSGGHITPLLAVAVSLRKQYPDVRLVYIGETRGKHSAIATESGLFDECHAVSAGKLRRYHGESWFKRVFDVKTNMLNIRDVFRLGLGTLQSYFLLRRLAPDSMLLKGGFVCVPLAFGARLLHIPFITHDSDALPGLSNRIASRWARYQAVGMPPEYYRYPTKTVRYVGVPVDERFRQYSKSEQAILCAKYNIPPGYRVILITGGSNGARRMNEGVISILPTLLKRFPDLYVLHQIGAQNQDQTVPLDRVTYFEFTNELFHMSAIADVVITRAGASAMADLAMQSKACVIVPNPFLTGGHQLHNARVYEQAGAAKIVSEDELQQLPEVITDLLENTASRVELGKKLHNVLPAEPADQAIARLLMEISVS